MFYRIVKKFLAFFINVFVFRVEVRGKENVLLSGGAILAINHRSSWDPLIAAISTPRKMQFMAKAELFKFKPFAKLIRALGAFPIQRGKCDVGAVKTALTILKNEDMMVIFPQGTRDMNEEKKEAKPGAVMFAIRAKVPIIPMYIEGNFKWQSKMIVHIGKPITYEEFYDKKPVVDELQKMSNELLRDIRALKEAK